MLVGIVLLVLILAFIGFLVNLVITKVPMEDSFKQVIIVVVVFCLVIYCLALITGHAELPTLPVFKN